MKKIKTIAVAKKDVQKLTGEELKLLSSFPRSPIYKVLEKIAGESKIRRALEALEDASFDQSGVSASLVAQGMNIGVDFILDSTQRAKEEMASRKKAEK